MANWRDEYFAALVVRDRRDQANTALFDAYTCLADRSVQAVATATQQIRPEIPTASKRPGPGPLEAAQSLQETLAAVRSDLTAAQQSRTELQDRLSRTAAELEKLKKKSIQDGRRITALEGERTHLQMRLKDRDEELRGKAKLLDSVQDELASLNLQLNMSEEKSNRLQKENQELIDRWMARMGREAEAMNNASKFS